jgi:hypothetical protein
LLLLVIAGCNQPGVIISRGQSDDAYLGFSGLRLKATGYFRLEEKNGKSFFVNPNGNPYLALSVTHFFWGNTENIPGREIVNSLKSWNYNAAGYDVEEDMKPLIPFLWDIFVIGPTKTFHQRLYTPNKMENRMWDIFDPRVVAINDSIIKADCALHKDNPNLIGYYLIDCPIWYIKNGRKVSEMDYASFIKQLPASAPGKKAYVKFLKKKYSNIEALNNSYRTTFKSFSEIMTFPFKDLSAEGSNEYRDDHEFLGVIAGQYYSTVCRSVRRYDTNHLILGDKYTMPNQSEENVLRAAAKYVDVISTEAFGRDFDGSTGKNLSEIHRITGKPIMICDHDSRDEKMRGADLRSFHHERAVGTGEFISEALATGYIIGCAKCQYFDCFSDPKGIVNQDNTPRSQYVDVISQKNLENLQMAYDAIKMEYRK